MHGPYREEYIQAMDEEIRALQRTRTWNEQA